MSDYAAYSGPQCPRCGATLGDNLLRTGHHLCPFCLGGFEATAFDAPQRAVARPELVVAGPEEASACANHARNAAVTSCARCGLFICALCEMNVGGASYCPSCFDRMRTDGSLKAATRYRDFALIARLSALCGLLFVWVIGMPLGALAIYYAVKGRKQRLEEGRSGAGMVITMGFGAIAFLIQFGIIVWVLWAIVTTA